MYRKETFERFIEVIKEKIPERGKRPVIIGKILNMEKESVYRRLRGDVPFVFSEIITLAKELDISIDSLLHENQEKSRPFQLKMVDFENPHQDDFSLLENFLKGLQLVGKEKDSEVGGALNILPQSFCLGFENLYKFYLFKWRYQYSGSEDIKSYREIIPSAGLRDMNEKIRQASRKAAYTYLIWDEKIYHNLITDIQYFASINLITREEVLTLKKELLDFLDYTDMLAANGVLENGNKINFYVSNVTFETSYSYIEAGNYHLTMIKSFTLNDATTTDDKIFQRMKQWMHSLKRTSTLISESGQMQRIRFFEHQRAIINSL